MPEIDLHVVPLLEPERPRAFVCAVTEQGRGRQDVAPARLAACDPLELAQLFERIDPDVRVGTDADADRALAHTLDGKETVAEVRLRRRTRADPRTCPRKQVELVAVRMSRVHHSGPLAETPRAVQ
jgi:hypothetical protein